MGEWGNFELGCGVCEDFLGWTNGMGQWGDRLVGAMDFFGVDGLEFQNF